MPVAYQDLVNVGGTIKTKSGTKAYKTNEELAADLGIAPHQIDWAKIAPETATPAPPAATGNAYTIKSGDTLSAIAKAQGTTVSEIMKVNPSIKNPNLIIAGKTLNLPWQASQGAGQAVDYASVNNVQQANQTINAAQTSDAAAKTATEEPPVKNSYTELNGLLDKIIGSTKPADTSKTNLETISAAVKPTTEKPAPINLASTYENYRTKYGINDLETQANDLAAEKAALLATKQARVNAERKKTVATNVIEGRVSEVERQENERIAAIDSQINTVNNQLTTKYNVVNTLMNLTGKDYDNAVSSYDKEMSTNIALFNTLRGIDESAKNDAERAKDNARSSLQIVYNNITSGGTSLSDLPSDTKTLISKLEVQAGLPSGFYQTLQNKNPKAEIVSTSSWTSSDNKQYVSVITKDATTGELKTQNILLGTVKAGSGDKATDAELKLYYKNNMTSELQKVQGSDGYISPESWAKAKKSWVANTPYSEKDFDDNFRSYANPSHIEDYSGLKEL